MRLKRSSCLIIRCLVCTFVAIVVLNTYYHNRQRSLKSILFAEIPDSAKTFILFEEEKTEHLNTTTLQRIIKQRNQQEHIRNIDVFGPITKNTNIIVIRVHKFSDNQKLLLASLSSVKGIQDTLIIFSHSFFDRNLNRLIEKIDFCRVLQIFYPSSLQLYPNVFPGFNFQDCPFNLNEHTAAYLKCTGSSHPDIHGRYRKPEYSEKKHHWWWTANKVFEDISSLKGKHGIVVFMDDDNYVLEDFLYLVIYMKRVTNLIPCCEIISLGVPNSNYMVVNESDTYRLQITTWEPKYSEVIGFDYLTWNTIVAHFDLFCLIDDYSWSRSIQYISLNRLEGKRFKVISPLVPRSFKSSCGLNVATNCGVNEGVFKALSVYKKYKKYLFPPFLEVNSEIEFLM